MVYDDIRINPQLDLRRELMAGTVELYLTEVTGSLSRKDGDRAADQIPMNPLEGVMGPDKNELNVLLGPTELGILAVIEEKLGARQFTKRI